MKIKTFSAMGAALAVLLFAGCSLFPPVRGSGFLTTTNFSLSGFTRIDASQTFKVRVVPDAAFAVTVISDDNLVEYFDIRVSSGTLMLALKPMYNYTNIIITAEVRMPALAGIGLSGAAEARVDSGFPRAASMSLGLSGASNIVFPNLSCGSLHVEASGASAAGLTGLSADALTAGVSGASTVTAAGSAGSESLEISGASTADLRDCVTGQASVNVSGASKAWVNVPAGSISLNASGASTLYYRGSPSFNGLSVSGGTVIVHVN